jgi:hypothetical protein
LIEVYIADQRPVIRALPLADAVEAETVTADADRVANLHLDVLFRLEAPTIATPTMNTAMPV